MDQNALVVAEVAQLVRLDFVFLGFGVVHIALKEFEALAATRVRTKKS